LAGSIDFMAGRELGEGLYPQTWVTVEKTRHCWCFYSRPNSYVLINSDSYFFTTP
jgi:hypothetical protein